MTATLRPPRVRLSWPATSLTIYFHSYRVWSRPSTLPAHPWILRGEITVPPGYTATTVEAQHTRFDDYLAGWYSEGGEWSSGHDWIVTSVDITGAESQITQAQVTASGLTVTDPHNCWWVTNQLPPLNCPIEIINLTGSELNSNKFVKNYVGRNKNVVITASEQPGRSLSTSAEYFTPVGPFELAQLRKAANSGLQFAMLRPLGDRIVGSPYVTGFDDAYTARQTVRIGMLETIEDAVADYNLPAGVVLNGSSQYLTTPSATQLNPGSSAFSVVMAAQFSATASKYALSKGNLGTSDGYGLRTTGTANQLQFFVDGATTSGGPAETSTAWFNDVRVVVGTTTGTAQVLYRDGAQVATSAVTHGAVTNSVALVAGANNAGGSAFSALAPLRAYAVYLRALTADEALAASYYLRGYPGYRMPAGASIFVDHRNDQCWNGVSASRKDLSPWANTITAVASPVTRGIPWSLSKYELV